MHNKFFAAQNEKAYEQKQKREKEKQKQQQRRKRRDEKRSWE